MVDQVTGRSYSVYSTFRQGVKSRFGAGKLPNTVSSGK